MQPREQEHASCECGGVGDSRRNLRLTGLCVLAYLSAGSDVRKGGFRKVVTQAVKWLRTQQDYASGRFRGCTVHGHSIATLALLECYRRTGSPTIKATCEKGLGYLNQAPSGFHGWQTYPTVLRDYPGTASPWIALLVPIANHVGLSPSEWLRTGSERWVHSVLEPGALSHGHFATAGALLTQLTILFEQSEQVPEENAATFALLQHLPAWDPADSKLDLESWYLATCVFYQLGRPHWPVWRRAMAQTVLDGQRSDGHLAGSWDPVGVDRFRGGRVHSTAMMVLCLAATLGLDGVLGAW